MVFHIAGTLYLGLALELLKQLRRLLAEDIDQYIETTTVRHPQHDFLGPVGGAAIDHFLDHRNQALATFQAKSFGTGVLGTEVFFQALGGGE